MLKYIANYRTVFDEKLNTDIMNRVHDSPLLECVLECWYSLEVMKGITILSWTYTDRESEIDINDYIFKRERGKKKEEKCKYKFIDDSRLGLLVVKVKLELDYRDVKDGQMKHGEETIEKAMLIPLKDELGRYFLNGKTIYLIYQLVEKSTYTASNMVILKSLMPFAIKRAKEVIETTAGIAYTVPRYQLELFKKHVDVMLIYASNGGMDWALQFALEAPYVIMGFTEEEDINTLTDIYFKVNNNIYLRVDKKMFENFIFVRSIVASILHICSNSRLRISMLNDPEVWLKKLGDSNPDKGRSLLLRAARLLDKTTKRILRLDEYHKHDVLTVTRWLCEEYNDLRFKDNMDLNNKRLRDSEIFSAMLTLSFSDRLNRAMSMGKKATLENYEEIFAFPGDLLVQIIGTSGIQRYNDVINDCDFFSKFKYTIKGPNSLGNRNSKNISNAYRGLHYSFIGRIDLVVCGNSDPGTSGLLTPFGKMDGLYFNDDMEPDDEVFRLRNAVEDLAKQKNIQLVTVNFENKEDFYKAMNAFRYFSEESVKAYSSSENNTIIVDAKGNSIT